MNPYSSKFDGCSEDVRLVNACYNAVMNGGCSEEIGDVESFGWYGLLVSRNGKVGYICHEDNQGFFDACAYPIAEARAEWANIEQDYAEFDEADDTDA